MSTKITKESLLNYALTAPLSDATAVYAAALVRMTELNAIGAGFAPFPGTIKPAGSLRRDDVLAWVRSVRQPQGEEFASKLLRNALVYEVEKLGEFCETLQARVSGGV